MRTLMFVVAIAAAAAGCTLEDSDSYSGAEFHATIKNRLASNRLASNRLASNRLASNRLASNSLSGTELNALEDTAEILLTEEGRDVYSYIISCALPAGTEIHYQVPGAPITDTDCNDPDPQNCRNYDCTGNLCTFYGNVGLAPRWLDHKLSPQDRGWVSACMFARVNANDVAEAISMRGRHEGLLVSPEEADTFSLEEGAFYGNLFIDDPDRSVAPDWNACRGEDKYESPTLGGLGNRRCTEENIDGNAEFPNGNPGYTYCNFKFHGNCRDFVPGPSACRTYDAEGNYNDCRGSAERGRKSRQVITVYVSG